MYFSNGLTFITVLTIVLSGIACADSAHELANEQPHTKATPRYWYDGHRKQTLWQSIDEFVIHSPSKTNLGKSKALKKALAILPTDAKIIEANEAWTKVRFPTIQLKQSDTQPGSVKATTYRSSHLSNVYYESKFDSSTATISTEQVIVHFKQIDNNVDASTWGKHHDLNLIQSLHLGRAFLYQCEQAETCLDKANNAYRDEATLFAYPNWLKPSTTREINHYSTNDPLLNSLWHLDNTGQNGGVAHEDANVMTAWNTGYGSKNEVIAVIDNGLDIYHEDLAENIIPGLNRDFVDQDNNPSGGSHGTNSAGVAAARGGNAIGISGVAPRAGLVGIRLLGARTPINEATALTLHNNKIDIYSNSWGPADIGQLNGPSPLSKAALLEGIHHGRQGKGSIYVWAAGNGYRNKDNSNYDGYANSPYTIAVAASTNTGTHAWYSESGANLWLNAPSSGGTLKITTTHNSTGKIASSDNYRSTFGGTSAAAPLVAGVVALMLEQNPQLGWRDVQHILANTAYQNDAGDSDWVTNGAGHWINHKYGFGRVDAAAASAAARNWQLLPLVNTINHSLQPNVLIPDNSHTGIRSNINIQEDISIDYVEIGFQSEHTHWGDLEISLISPSGTSSVLAETSIRKGAAYQDNWVFGVARLLDESSYGRWTLAVKDKSKDHTGHLQSWSIKVYGSTNTNSTPDAPNNRPQLNAQIKVNQASINHRWKTIALNATYQAPVVITGPPSFNDPQPVTTRLQNIHANYFEMRIQEWDYLDTIHKQEYVPYLVMESGHYSLANNTQWEAGTYTQGGTGQWQSNTFKQAFIHSPLIFLTMQTAYGNQAVIVRAQNITRFGFDSALFEQEAFMDGHKPEIIGYLAIDSQNSTIIQINQQATSYQLHTLKASHQWSRVNTHMMIKAEEEISTDQETDHLCETLAILQVQNHVFAQDISSQGRDTTALRIKNISD